MKEALYNLIAGTGVRTLSKIFPEYFAKDPLKPTDRYIEYPFVIRNLLKPPARILDIGCAGSFFPLIIAAMGYDVTACDIRTYDILNNLEFKNFRFIQQDICKNFLPEENFDVVTCISVLEHIGLKGRYGAENDLDGDLKMVKEIKRVLKTGGRAFITVPYGITEVLLPHQRIYDLAGIKKISYGFTVAEERFYFLDQNNDWKECSAKEGQLKKCSSDKYGLALLYLKKP